MNLRSEREVANTRKKLQHLEELYKAAENEPSDDEELREMEMESLKRFINQLKEEIARYEAHQPSSREAARS